ncbi:MAG: BatA domain-containing protein [Verrucomicrobiota bacterium]
MSFLNLALLGGAAAFLIPILIHLFHKSRFEVVKWGAMHLLESVIRVNQRRVRIEQLILMMVRAAIPLLLALAMARPVWSGAKKLMGETKSSTVILLDNSYSMEAGRTGVSNFSTARDEATRLISDLKRGSDVQVILMGEGGQPCSISPLTTPPASPRRSGNSTPATEAPPSPPPSVTRPASSGKCTNRRATSSCSPISSASVSRRPRTRSLVRALSSSANCLSRRP